MSQHDMDIATADANTGITFRAAVNAALQALVSNNSGATAPSTTYSFMLWADTANNLLKMRNAANTGWITIGSTSLGLDIVAKALYTANSILYATTSSTPAALTVGASTIVGRKATGGIVALTAAEAKAILAIVEADITLADNTTGDVSTSKHGFVPKAPNDTTKFLRGDATWGIPLSTGMVKQCVSTVLSTGLTATSPPAMPYTSAIPQSSQGMEVMTRQITCTSGNKLEIEANVLIAASRESRMTLAFFRDSETDAFASGGHHLEGGRFNFPLTLKTVIDAPGTGTYTFKVRLGSMDGSLHMFVNGNEDYSRLQASVSVLTIREIIG